MFEEERIPKGVIVYPFLILLCPANLAHCLELSFAWDPNTEPDLAGYRIFYREKGQDYDYDNPAWQGMDTTATIYNLDANATYYFVSRAYDICCNESVNSVELCYESGTITYSSEGGGGGGGGCFIATAAYGSPLDPHVTLLRQFRDDFLLPHAAQNFCAPVLHLLSAHSGFHFGT